MEPGPLCRILRYALGFEECFWLLALELAAWVVGLVLVGLLPLLSLWFEKLIICRLCLFPWLALVSQEHLAIELR